MTDVDAGIGPRLSVGFVPGVQPDKWLGRWRERNPDVPVVARRSGDPRRHLAAAAGDDGYDVIFLREPDDAPRAAPPGLLRIPLYTETMAVVAHEEHEIAAFASLTTGDLVGERWLDPVDTVTAGPDEVSAAVDLVAAGVGLLVLPQPYARSLSRKDVVERPLHGVPATRMGVAWSPGREGDELIDAFVGIVRGRTASSSRGAAPQQASPGARSRGTPPRPMRARRTPSRRTPGPWSKRRR